MRTVAIYGGSFNPPHIGHAMVVQWLLWSKVDEVLIVPSANHPHGKTHAPFGYRVQMLRQMVEDLGGGQDDFPVMVSEVEQELAEDGPVFTYNLLSHLDDLEQYRDAKLRFVIGADILEQTDSWHLWDRVKAEFDLLILGRDGYPSPDGAPIIPDFSSSRIRNLIRMGDSKWEHMVTPSVRDLLPGPYTDEPALLGDLQERIQWLARIIAWGMSPDDLEDTIAQLREMPSRPDAGEMGPIERQLEALWKSL